MTETRATTNGQKLTKVTKKVASDLEGDAERARLQGLVAGARLVMAPPDHLYPSPFHKRRAWGDLDELAKTILEVGIVEPLLARALGDDASAGYELVFGHRRLRAVALARAKGWTGGVPVRVAPLTDADVVTIMAIENLARTDLHPLEEAEEYEQLIKVAKIRAEDIGARVGKSRSHVYGRIKLLNLCPKARKAFAEDAISPSIALYVARIPHATLQIEALKVLVRHKEDDPVGARQAFRIIEGRFMLRLADAPWDRGDAELLPAAGSCVDCGKRTGNQRELFADVASGDVCTDPVCFADKRKAHEARHRAELKAKGVKVLEGKKHPHSPDYVVIPEGYVPAGEPQYAHGNKKIDGKKAAQLLKDAKIDKPERAVYFDGQGKAVELLPAAAVKAARKKLGDGPPKPPGKSGGSEEKLSRAQTQALTALEEEIREQIITLAAKKPGSDATWRLVGALFAPYARKSYGRASGTKLATIVLTEAMTTGVGADVSDDELVDVAKLFGIDVLKARKAALAALEKGDEEPAKKGGRKAAQS